ncbi:HXXEE domain-containing protein [Brachybacterium alimentarium]|uniref:HXXEE domain-containing protein n=1 Tax=Brachybacterium alimentarium TaxID=47845 RepID=UPI000DF25B2E|nr:HXXEE domain-containing protein [Brachybacterium alimentarium]RCS82592.1 HXXEE domain-containing protein [Brachybacterium alimentarium]
MSLDLIVWISVALLLVHEFEEIVTIRPWLSRHRDDPRARRQVFWSFRNTSTSIIAAMIFEEYVIFAVIAFTVVLIEQPAVFAGLMIPYTLHLVSHIAEAIRLGMRTPSVLSSAITLPWCLYAIVELIRQAQAPLAVGAWTVVFTVVIAANFALIYRLRPALERRLTEHPPAGE